MDLMTIARIRTTFTEKQYVDKCRDAVKQHPQDLVARHKAYTESYAWLTAKFAMRKGLVTPDFYHNAALFFGKMESGMSSILKWKEEIENGRN